MRKKLKIAYMLQGNRTEYTPEQLQRAATEGVESVIDRNLAREDAHKLYQAGVKKIGTDESAFLQVMAVRHYYQLRATFEEYHKVLFNFLFISNYMQYIKKPSKDGLFQKTVKMEVMYNKIMTMVENCK